MKKLTSMLMTAVVTTSAFAFAPAQPAPGGTPSQGTFVEHIRITEYIMDIRPASTETGARPAIVPGVVRHGRWIYPAEGGGCEQLEITLHGFILIPTADGSVVQQPDTSARKQPVACPQPAAKE